MVRIRSAASQGVRAIICLKFAGEAEAAKIDALKRRLLGLPFIQHAIDCSGSFDFMLEVSSENLSGYLELIEDVRRSGKGLIEDFEHCVVCRRYIPDREDQGVLWLPTSSGRRRVPVAMIDKVTADGDYVRLHAGSTSWLLHSTLCAMERMLAPADFIRVSRSLLVRRDLVEQVVHDDHSWLVLLQDGSSHRVPRARSQQVRSQLGIESSMQKAISPTVA